MLLVACDDAEDREPLVATGEPPVDAGPEEIPLDRPAIAAQREVWLAARPAAYAYEVETTCDCALAGTYGVTVEGETVLAVESRDPDAERYRAHPAPALDTTFAMLDEPLALAESGEIPAGRATATFDPTYGYPTSFTIEGSGDLPSYRVVIRDFVPLDPAALDRRPALALVVSNQSFDDPDVGLTVTVDGEVVVDRSFAVEGQHNDVGYRVPLAPGDHQLIVRADTGATHERVVTIAGDRSYVYVAYWGGDPSSAEAFSVSESDEPFGFA